MKKLLSLAIIAAFIGFQGCSTDFEVTGDYKELSIVYGLLDFNNNPSNGGDGHFVRIQKSFLGEIDAALMAANPDSSYFRVEDLEVKLVEFDEDLDEITREILLEDTMVENKDTTGGYGFFGPEQRLYHTNENLIGGSVYDLVIHNHHTGYRDSIEYDDNGKRKGFQLINSDDFRFSSPTTASPKFIFYDPNSGYRPRTITCSNPIGVKTGELWLRFHYREILTGSNDTLFKSTDLLIARYVFEDSEMGRANTFSYSFDGELFYQHLGNVLEPLAGHRLSGIRVNPSDITINDAFEMFTYIGGEDLHEYIVNNTPSASGAVNEVPVTSNMTVGKGLISSRSQKFFGPYLYFDTFSTNELIGGQYTGDLGFIE